MSVLKCKMCGGELTVEEGASVAVCEYCGSKQTVPKADDEKKVNLFNRANRLRMACEFDKAAAIYEQIIAEFPEEAEAYWGLCLSNYGIEYVDDPATAKKIPTCHRASFEKMRKDENYELALENADTLSRVVYEEQAKEIDRIMGDILKVSRDEEPYDIFICYKESDSSGNRTPDSVLAQDIYDALTAKNYRVFFSRISLEDKLGTQYEPYIFSALNSAKMMLVIGTDYEYMNAVWVKNEWSRFIKLMEKDKTKILIPCYKDMDPYDMPDELKSYQSQDCGKLGFMQDLLRGIDKLTGRGQNGAAGKDGKDQSRVAVQQVSGGPNVTALLDRGNMALEDGKFADAKTYFDQVLSMDARCAEAYLGMFMAEIGVKNTSVAAEKFIAGDYLNNRNWQRAKQFAKGTLSEELSSWEIKRETRLKEEAEQKRKLAEEEQRKRKEEQRKRKEEEETFAREKAQFIEQYTNGTLVYPPTIGDDANKLTAELAALKKEVEKLEEAVRLCEDESASAAECGLLKETEEKLADRKRYRSSLGIFKGKERKEVQEEINRLKHKADEYRKVIQEKELRVAEAKERSKTARKKADSVQQEIKKKAGRFIYEQAKKYGIQKLQAEYSQPGDTMFFGIYEQDNNTANGKEDIEWTVLAKEGEKRLLISKYALETRPYNTQCYDVTWENCTLRTWLNTEFYTAAFSAEEQKLILETTVTADKNPRYGTDPGNSTKDKVFLLSIPEVEKYFANDEDRRCAPTAYAKAQGVWLQTNMKTAGGEDACQWWLRSPGDDRRNADVSYGGSVYETGFYAVLDMICVRPALWIDLKS